MNLSRHRYAEKQSAQLEQIEKEFTRCSRGFHVVPPEDKGSTNDSSRERRRQATREVLQQLEIREETNNFRVFLLQMYLDMPKQIVQKILV